MLELATRPTPALPSGPRMPAFLQILNWIYRPIPFMEECSRRYGDWFTLRFPDRFTLAFTSDPAAVRDVFAGDHAKLHAGRINVILKPLLGEHSLLILDGPGHLAARRLMMPPFHGERMKAYGRLMAELADQAAARWPRGRPFPVHPEMQAVALDVILRAVLGLSEGPLYARLRGLLVRLLHFSANPLGLMIVGADGEVPFARLQEALGPLLPWGRISRVLREVDSLLLGAIAARRAAQAPGEDVLAMLLAARDEKGRGLADAELRDEMMTLLLAGHETSATTLSWALILLAGHPQFLARLQAELDAAGGAQASPEALAGLPALDAAVQETLRLRPVVPFVGRWLEEPASFGGRSLPAGVVVCPCIYLAHRRPGLWPEPDRFRPERFLERRPGPGEFFPFGGGARRCLGMAFALYEIKIVLARAVLGLDLAPAPGYRPRVVRRGITFAPSEGAPLVVRSRQSN